MFIIIICVLARSVWDAVLVQHGGQRRNVLNAHATVSSNYQSQPLNRNIPHCRTSHSPSIGTYPAAGSVVAPQ
eukprot:1191555-Prorocentrum_minimum.AAC.2